MRIAQVAPLYESVPPALYGGTERVVSYLTEELVRQGHEVVLYASGDSRTAAELRAPIPRAIRLDDKATDGLAHHVRLMEHVFRDSDEFDIIHFHIDYLHFPMSRRMSTPQLTTLHGRLDMPDLGPVYDEFGDMPVVSISDAQRRPLPQAGWHATVHHGLPAEQYALHEETDGYLAFIGRISPEKRLDLAIEIAAQVNRPLRVAAKIDRVDSDYYERFIRPLLQHPLVEFVGEIGDEDKLEFLGRASALVMPIDWPEPFGLVMIESLACGTPVIGFDRGSVPELLTEGESGFICRNVQEAVDAAHRIDNLSRRRCREIFEQRFTAVRMTQDYLDVYRDLAGMRDLERERIRAHPQASAI